MATRPLAGPGPTTRCPECGAEVRCGAARGEGTCWCDDLPPLQRLRLEPGAAAPPACLCEACLRKRLREEGSAS